MAKNKNGRNVAKTKYSYNDRADYHKSRYRAFIDKFTSKKGVMYHTDFEALINTLAILFRAIYVTLERRF